MVSVTLHTNHENGFSSAAILSDLDGCLDKDKQCCVVCFHVHLCHCQVVLKLVFVFQLIIERAILQPHVIEPTEMM